MSKNKNKVRINLITSDGSLESKKLLDLYIRDNNIGGDHFINLPEVCYEHPKHMLINFNSMCDEDIKNKHNMHIVSYSDYIYDILRLKKKMLKNQIELTIHYYCMLDSKDERFIYTFDDNGNLTEQLSADLLWFTDLSTGLLKELRISKKEDK